MVQYFNERVFPVLTPLAIDAGHPFPYISKLSLSLAVELRERRKSGDVDYVARVKVPPSLPRFVPIEAPAGQRWFVLVEDLIAHNLQSLFPGMTIVGSYAFRVTRDADLDLQEDEADDLLRAIESELRKRRFGEPVRLEVRERNAGRPARDAARRPRTDRFRRLRHRRHDGDLSVMDAGRHRRAGACTIRRSRPRFPNGCAVRPISSR